MRLRSNRPKLNANKRSLSRCRPAIVPTSWRSSRLTRLGLIRTTSFRRLRPHHLLRLRHICLVSRRENRVLTASTRSICRSVSRPILQPRLDFSNATLAGDSGLSNSCNDFSRFWILVIEVRQHQYAASVWLEAPERIFRTSKNFGARRR